MIDLSKLMLESQKGREGSYSELLLHTSMILDTFLVKKIKSSDERDDLINTILSSCHNNRHTYTPNVSYHAWLFSIAKIHIKTYYKNIGKIQIDSLNKKIDEFKIQLYQSQRTIKPENLTIIELKNLFTSQFNRGLNFPPFQMKILALLVIQNESLEEISKKLKVNITNIKIVIIRILQNIKEE
jgi:DNA-directed RNA polymerase specialized sigma24 family protein